MLNANNINTWEYSHNMRVGISDNVIMKYILPY